MAITLIVISMMLCITGFELFAGTRREATCWLLLLGAVLCIVTLAVFSLIIIARRWRSALLGLAAAAIGSFWVVMSFALGGDRIIARANAPDGTEMCVIQFFTGDWGEPYRVSFYYRRPGQQWGWFYYEHEDTRWWFGSIKLTTDGKRAEIRRFVSPVAYFDLPNEAFTIIRWNRTTTQAQEWMAAGWEPENEVSGR